MMRIIKTKNVIVDRAMVIIYTLFSVGIPGIKVSGYN